MYVGIGGDMAVRDRSIIGIFDLDNTTTSRHTRRFLSEAEQHGVVIDVSGELPKSFVLTQAGHGARLSDAVQHRRHRPENEIIFLKDCMKQGNFTVLCCIYG